MITKIKKQMNNELKLFRALQKLVDDYGLPDLPLNTKIKKQMNNELKLFRELQKLVDDYGLPDLPCDDMSEFECKILELLEKMKGEAE